MTDGSRSKVVQRYRPSGLTAASHVSVSGLDVSRDKRELLVSYENDQVWRGWALLSVLEKCHASNTEYFAAAQTDFHFSDIPTNNVSCWSDSG